MAPERAKRLGLVAFGLSLATLVAVASGSASNWRKFSYHAELVSASRLILTLNHDIRTSLADAETDQTGYLLTGSTEYRKAFQSAAARIPAMLDELAVTTQTHPDVHPKVRVLHDLASQKIDYLAEGVRLRSSRGLASALEITSGEMGRDQTAKIQAIAAEIETAQLKELQENWDELVTEVGIMRWITLGGTILLAGLVVAAAIALARAVNRQAAFTAAASDAGDLLRTTLYSIGDGVIVTDGNGSVRLMNPVAERLTGTEEKLAAGRPADELFKIVDEETRREEPNPIDRVLRGGGVVTLPRRSLLVNQNGAEIPIDDNGAPIVRPNGSLEGAVLVFRDITEHRKADEALLESERRFRSLADSAPVMIWSETPDGKRDYFNSRWLEYRGRTIEDERGQGWREGLHPDDQARYEEVVEKAYEDRTPFTIECRLRRADGRYCWTLCRGVPRFDASNRFLGYLGTCADIDELKRTEERLRHAAKLESLGVLAGGIAHDFNNILVGILGSACLLEDYVPPDSPGRELVATLQQASERAARLTRQMLAYSGRGRFYVEPLDLSAQVRDVMALIGASIPKTVELRVNAPDDLPRVAADATQIQQVIMNLAVNAAEAIGPQGGWVEISTSTEEVSEADVADFENGAAAQPGSYVVLRVADNGAGMDTETRSRMFDPFFTTKFAGRGLGLAAVLGIVRSHRGGIKVTSAPAGGSVFSVYLPAFTELRDAPPEHPALKADLRGSGTVLVVDDEEPVRQVAKSALQRFGFTVETASNGEEAIQMLLADPASVRVMVMDLSMPGPSPEETLARIREVRPDLPVVLASGYTEIDVTQRFGSAVSGFLSKPFTLNALAETIGAALQPPGESG